MVSLTIRLFTDEHIDPRLAQALARRGFDALSCHQAGRANRQISDDDQLDFAAREGRTLLTFNVVDFIALDTEWKRDERTHAGISVSPAIRSLSDLMQRVERHMTTVPWEQQDNALLWLGGPGTSFDG